MPPRAKSCASQLGRSGVMALLALYCGPALAQAPPQPAFGGLTADSNISETGSWSSNPLLATRDAKSLWGSTTTPQLLINDTTPESLLSFDTTFDENIFDQAAFNSSDVHEVANQGTHNDLWNAGLQEKIDYDTTRTSELSNFGIAPLVARHTGFSATPTLSYTPTSADTLAFTGSVLSSHYDNIAFTNYATYSVSPSYTHYVDPLNAAVLSFQAQRYLTTYGPSIHIDSMGPSFGWQTTISQRLTANASIGAQTTRQYDPANVTPWTWQYTFAGGLMFKGIQDTINFTTAREQYPYGNGTEALQTNFYATEIHNLNPLVSLNFGANYLNSTYESSTLGSLKSLAGANVGSTYHATERLDLTATYQYRYETLTSGGLTAKDQTATLNLVYHPKLWTPAP